jgi:hypothetical protein
VDLLPDPLPLRKSGSAENRIQDLWVSQELWPLHYRGGRFYLHPKLNPNAIYCWRANIAQTKTDESQRRLGFVVTEGNQSEIEPNCTHAEGAQAPSAVGRTPVICGPYRSTSRHFALMQTALTSSPPSKLMHLFVFALIPNRLIHFALYNTWTSFITITINNGCIIPFLKLDFRFLSSWRRRKWSSQVFPLFHHRQIDFHSICYRTLINHNTLNIRLETTRFLRLVADMSTACPL